MGTHSRRGNIIKWYEYTMEAPKKEDELSEDDAENIGDYDMAGSDNNMNSPDSIASNGVHERYGDEEIDLDTIDMDDSDKELVASIMAKFKDAKQESVDSLFDGN